MNQTRAYLDKWHQGLKSQDQEFLDEILDDSCIFTSPIVFKPIQGKEMSKLYLMGAGKTFVNGQAKINESSSIDPGKQMTDEWNIVLFAGASYPQIIVFEYKRKFDSSGPVIAIVGIVLSLVMVFYMIGF